jgi:hypothetical protein
MQAHNVKGEQQITPCPLHLRPVRPGKRQTKPDSPQKSVMDTLFMPPILVNTYTMYMVIMVDAFNAINKIFVHAPHSIPPSKRAHNLDGAKQMPSPSTTRPSTPIYGHEIKRPLRHPLTPSTEVAISFASIPPIPSQTAELTYFLSFEEVLFLLVTIKGWHIIFTR